MSSELINAMGISVHGMKAQGSRIRVITENVANVQTTGDTPGADPYRRQMITFKNEMDRQMGAKLVKVDSIQGDEKTPFRLEYRPEHPAADENGNVKLPNVNTLLEMADMREAQRTYEANIGMLEQSRTMLLRTIDLLRA
ncbi:MAG: flagellar basal body rod protein FlgC [Micavibrio sp.]|nr:flagellar basal body rod protein FlgC [Micavibrio sp.]|tara:strand:+ start:17318 stop:17737 length:420 start_codon:yes stop_codon:yes gene_type:complete